MRPIRKNKFFEFMFSFIPGAAEMYMGFMKNGFSMMCIAGAVAVLAGFLSNSLLLLFGLAVWAFSFFHARNLSHLSVEELEKIEDKYIYEEFTKGEKIVITSKMKKVIGIFLVIIGCTKIWKLILHMVATFIPDDYWRYFYSTVEPIPEIAIFVFIMVLGVYIIRGKKLAIIDDEDPFDEDFEVELPEDIDEDFIETIDDNFEEDVEADVDKDAK